MSLNEAYMRLLLPMNPAWSLLSSTVQVIGGSQLASRIKGGKWGYREVKERTGNKNNIIQVRIITGK